MMIPSLKGYEYLIVPRKGFDDIFYRQMFALGERAESFVRRIDAARHVQRRVMRFCGNRVVTGGRFCFPLTPEIRNRLEENQVRGDRAPQEERREVENDSEEHMR